MISMQLTYVRAWSPEGGAHYVVSGKDTPPLSVRRNGRTWQYSETAPDGTALWWRGTFRTRQTAAEEGVSALSLDRDRDRARDALAVMDGAHSFDSVAGPRDQWSAGARFCLNVWEAARAELDENDDYSPGDYEGVYNRAECLSPIYTDHTWRLWVDLGAYDFPELDEEQNERAKGQSVTMWAQNVITRMAETAMIQLCDGWYEDRKCDECDEYPCECHLCADCYGDTRLGASERDACTCDPNVDPDPGRFPAHALPSLPPVPVPDADLKWTDHDVVTADDDTAPTCCPHCPDGCELDHASPDDYCGHCSDGCC